MSLFFQRTAWGHFDCSPLEVSRVFPLDLNYLGSLADHLGGQVDNDLRSRGLPSCMIYLCVEYRSPEQLHA